ncbi:MAG: PDZ domain-containing protein [Acidimicrobiia bacterium]
MLPLPYYLFRPGTVRDTEPLIEVTGGATYPSEGSISYTTVSLRQATLFGLMSGWIDDDVAVMGRDEVLGDHGAEENRQINLELMDNSKQVATKVALERLGYEVEVSITGHVVFEVRPGMPAEGVLSVGDTIVAVDDVPIDDREDLHRLLGEESPGSSVMITVESPEPGVPPAASPTLGPRGGDDEGGDRDGAGGQNGDQRDADRGDDPELERRDVEITLAASPDDPDRAEMGVTVGPRLDYHFPIDVAIDTGDVGGPSAGLAFTLGLIDDLTPGDLTGGLAVAVTGEIEADGTVGPVGGAGQKAAAVRAAGMDLFLVPSADYDAAVEHAGDVEVVRVDTLDEALEALAERGGNGLDLPQAGEPSERPAA